MKSLSLHLKWLKFTYFFQGPVTNSPFLLNLLVEELEGHLFFFLVISILYLFLFNFVISSGINFWFLIMFHITAFLDHVLADMHLHVINVVEVELVYS